ARKQGIFERYQHSEACVEEISERNGDRRFRRTVPVHVEAEGAQHLRRAVVEGDPHSPDDAGALDVQQRKRLAGRQDIESMTLGATILETALTLFTPGIFSTGPPSVHPAGVFVKLLSPERERKNQEEADEEGDSFHWI